MKVGSMNKTIKKTYEIKIKLKVHYVLYYAYQT